MAKTDRMSGNEAVAMAMKQINPDVMGAFPITPSTEIPQYFSQYIADGDVGMHRSVGCRGKGNDSTVIGRTGVHVGAVVCGSIGKIAYYHGGGKQSAYRSDKHQQ